MCALYRCVCDPGLAVRLSVVIGGVAMLFCPLIQYDHFTVLGGKPRYSAQHTVSGWPAGYIPDALGRIGGPEMQEPGTDSGSGPIDTALG